MDINGDGIDDLIMGGTGQKEIYVLLGSQSRPSDRITEADLDGTRMDSLSELSPTVKSSHLVFVWEKSGNRQAM